MKLIHVLILVYIVMFVWPLIGGLLSYHKDKNEPIFINQSKIKDPRYFAKSFTKSFFDRWSVYDNSGKIKISKSEDLDLADLVEKFDGEYNNVIASEFYDFIPSGHARFNKEIMVMQNAYLYGDIQIRAIKCMKDMIIGQGITVLRWVDAEGYLMIREHSDAGLSASSAHALGIGKNVKFKRLFAPVINIAMPQVKEIDPTKDIYGLIPNNHVRRDLDTVGEFDVDESRIWDYSIASNQQVSIQEDIIIQGHVRSVKGVRLLDRSIVCGNIFANQDIYIGRDVTVLGNIFTHGNIYLQDNVEIGQPHRISSIVASGTIDFGLNTRVFGYVHSEKGGTVFNEALTQGEINHRIAQEIRSYTIRPEEKIVYLQHQAQDYHNAFPLTFRNNSKIETIVIPEGVEVIRKSMFYGCTNLVKITLPSSLKEIEAFAFYGCTNLKTIEFLDRSALMRIGASAFEHCQSLESFAVSKHIETLEKNTFGSCSLLKSIHFDTDSELTTIKSHVFQHCSSLTTFECPSKLTDIGMSAFYGCRQLSLFKSSPNLGKLEDYVFAHCVNLDRSTLDTNITQLLSQSRVNRQGTSV